MIKNIIFDIGNVILSFNKDYLVRCIYNGDEFDLLKDKLFKNWERLDEDTISLNDYEEKVLSELPAHLKNYAKTVLNNWEYFVSHTKGTVNLIYELKRKGYKVYALSNMTRHFIKNEYKFPVFTEFDGIVYSAPIKMIKPSPEIYQYIINKYSLIPEECLFVDDMKTNLEAASRFGIQTFQYKNNTDELKKLIFSPSNH